MHGTAPGSVCFAVAVAALLVSCASAQSGVNRYAEAVAPEHPDTQLKPVDNDVRRLLDDRPIIGILSQPVKPESNQTYFAASYSHYARMAGARTMPVRCDSSKEELKDIFGKINGLVVPGGAQDLRPGNQYYDAQSYLMDLAMAAYDEDGETFPIHYTCLGWEAVAVKVTNNPNILANFTANNMAANLDWTDAAPSARMLKLVPPALLQAARTTAIAFEAHHFGVWLPDFQGSALAEFFTLLSTTRDRDGKVYVSTVEAKHYPILAVQWHPEKPSWEWAASTQIPHTLEAVQLSQAVANQFIEWARLSTHRYPTAEEEDAALLYNYQPTHTFGSYFDEIYSFDRRWGFSASTASTASNPASCLPALLLGLAACALALIM